MKKEVIYDLYSIGAIKFGNFTLISGMVSPIYINLRIMVSYPEILEKVADLISEELNDLDFDLIAGIPYTALPITSIISVKRKIPMVYARKEVKDYGTKKKIEGIFKKGDVCVVVDDLITKGDSKFETAEPFESEGLIVKDFVVLVDREQGGSDLLKKRGYNLHSIIPITELLDTLRDNKNISEEDYSKAKKFIEANKVA
ncbi:orotate phosphoribosyltransferase [bacterium (Candidatus Howlettbacteria) CG_4_10_14_0_8_um_filter_40_9]|nr:MAG: orotate phosphoribosyltransferase [bacterium (Candidatus Howlettbacteria) CG_4_10_14_0_8_um_filter_40_9]